MIDNIIKLHICTSQIKKLIDFSSQYHNIYPSLEKTIFQFFCI